MFARVLLASLLLVFLTPSARATPPWDAVTAYLARQLLEAHASRAGTAAEGDVEEIWTGLEVLHGDAVDFTIVRCFDGTMLARVLEGHDEVDRPDETQEEIVHRRFEERTRQEARDRYRRYRERPARELLTDPDPEARAYALGRLMEAGDSEILEHARRAATDRSDRVRLKAASIFANHPTPVPEGFARTIVDLADDPSEAVVEMAARALGNVEGFPPEVERRIRAMVDGESGFVRRTALRALSRQAAREARAWEMLFTLATSWERDADDAGDTDDAADAGKRAAANTEGRAIVAERVVDCDACWQLVQTENRADEVRRVVDRWLARAEHLDEIAIAARVQPWDDAYRLRVLTEVMRSEDLDAALTAAFALRWTLPLDPATRPLLRSLRDRAPDGSRGRVEQLIREVDAVEVLRGTGAR